MQLAVFEAGFDSAAPPPPAGERYYTVGLRGTGVSRTAEFALESRSFVFAQNDRGCVSRADPAAAWLKRPLGPTVVYSAGEPTEGEVSFLVPEDSQRIRVIVAPASEDTLIVPAGEDFTPTWPAPIQTIEDGGTLRLLVLPPRAVPVSLGAPPAGRERIVLDFVIENLENTQGIEFTTSQQLRLMDAEGHVIQPAAATRELGCRLDDLDVVPPGQARRFQVAYDMPSNTPRRLQYRGFEVEEFTVDIP